MSGRVAILAGAGGELGRPTAQKLAKSGFSVVGIDRNEEGLRQLPDGIHYEVGDPSDPTVAEALVARIAAEVGPPAVLVNTVGTYHLGDALTATREDLRLMLDVNTGTAWWPPDKGWSPPPVRPPTASARPPSSTSSGCWTWSSVRSGSA
jgi:NAD(P)-dependent dehydrogenase (short-subunit alcohol dehydrogenase family)